MQAKAVFCKGIGVSGKTAVVFEKTAAVLKKTAAVLRKTAAVLSEYIYIFGRNMASVSRQPSVSL